MRGTHTNNDDAGSALDEMQDQSTLDLQPHRTVARFVSRLYHLRRGHGTTRDIDSEVDGISFDPEELWKDEDDEAQHFDCDVSETSTKSHFMKSIYLVDDHEEKKLDSAYDDENGELSRRNVPRRSTTFPGAISVMPRGVSSPPNLQRYDSGALSSHGTHRFSPDDVLIQASLVPPMRKPFVVEASIMEGLEDDIDGEAMVLVHKQKLCIITCIVVLLLLGLSFGLAIALTRRPSVRQSWQFQNDKIRSSDGSSRSPPPRNDALPCLGKGRRCYGNLNGQP